MRQEGLIDLNRVGRDGMRVRASAGSDSFKKEELKKVAAAREARKKGDGQHARASTTDPEARKMTMGDGGFRPA